MNGIQNQNPALNFWQDAVDCWRRLPNKVFFFGLLAAWLALFQFLGNSILGYVHTPSLFLWMHSAYVAAPGSASDDAHGNFIPFLVVGSVLVEAEGIAGVRLQHVVAGIADSGGGQWCLHMLGYVVQQPALSIVALFTGIYGLMGLAWGPDWLRRCAIPLFPVCIFRSAGTTG